MYGNVREEEASSDSRCRTGASRFLLLLLVLAPDYISIRSRSAVLRVLRQRERRRRL